MTHVLTLVASGVKLSAGHLAAAASIAPLDGEPYWLDTHKAADLPVMAKPSREDIFKLREIFAEDEIDVFVTPRIGRQKKLVLCDMDSTIVTTETLDEIAGYAGLKDKISAITERAMRGELDFHAALTERVGMLKGLSQSVLDAVLAETKLTPNVRPFINGLKKQGVTCILVSGGFTFFTGAIAKLAGFDNHHGNTLEIKNGALTGRVVPPVLDKDSKLDFLKQYAGSMNIGLEETMAAGDGANDLPMLLAAGLGVGYKPKPLLLQQLDNCIVHGDLTAALYAQGYGNLKFS